MKKNRKHKVNDCYSHEIYSTGGTVTLVRHIQENLKPRKIVELLKLVPLKFAFLEINKKMYWVEAVEDTEEFWELEVKPHLCQNLNIKLRNKLARKKKLNFQINGYCYYASLWEAENLDKIIVLFMAH
jgi:CDP-glycerol glycerophosphotransferase (TagB/SpsB family)